MQDDQKKNEWRNQIEGVGKVAAEQRNQVDQYRKDLHEKSPWVQDKKTGNGWG
ncbi:hypothetical protein [Paenibacillus vini]|uniref:Uncharacterized protein n=1 Tax=Paenibacillus vini TaxID=1476024 RepID=A0ABQ4MGU2_9BACL|nr:hypothetical protein [Paenibacillus vini]GIP55204.1 hypothetical protein J42TS3_42390 [Paenibacillus vini]